MNRIALFLILACASLSANAFDYKRWMCNCSVDPILASST